MWTPLIAAAMRAWKPKEGARFCRAGCLTRDSGGNESVREDEPVAKATGDGNGRNTAGANGKPRTPEREPVTQSLATPLHMNTLERRASHERWSFRR